MRDFKFRNPIARIQLFNLVAPGGGQDDDGGGTTGSTGGSSPVSGGVSVDSSLITATGGLFTGELGFLIPFWDITTGMMKIGTFDFTDFNTEVPIKYKYRQEILMEGHPVTVSRLRFRYRDLGKVKVKFAVLTDENREPIKANSGYVTFGGKNDGKLYFEYFDKVITGINPQVYFERAAGAGSLCITRMTMITNVEIMEQI